MHLNSTINYNFLLEIERNMKKFSKVTAREVLENFQSDSEYGLSNAAVSSLKKIHGTNKIAEEEKVIKLISYHDTSTYKP